MRSMRRWSSAALLGLLAASARAQDTAPPIAPAAEAYLRAALDTLEAVTLHAAAIPWRMVRDSAFAIAAGARAPRDTYGAIDWALHRVNRHSFLQAPAPGAASELALGATRLPALTRLPFERAHI